MVNHGNKTRRFRFDPAMGFVTGDVNIPVSPNGEVPNNLYYNRQTQSRSENYPEGFSFMSPDVIGEEPQPARNYGGYLQMGNRQPEENYSFSMERMTSPTMPERDPEEVARMQKLAKIRAIAEIANTFGNMVSNARGGVTAGLDHSEFFNQRDLLDQNYANQMQEWSRQNFETQKFNVDAANREGLMNYEALQDKLQRNWQAEQDELDRIFRGDQSDKDRDVANRRTDAMTSNSNANMQKYLNDQQEQEYQQKRYAIDNLQQERDARASLLENMSSSDPRREGVQREIRTIESRIQQMNNELSGWEGFSGQPGAANPPAREPFNPTMMYQNIDQFFPSGLDETFDVGDNSYSAQELLDVGWSPAQIRSLKQGQ